MTPRSARARETGVVTDSGAGLSPTPEHVAVRAPTAYPRFSGRLRATARVCWVAVAVAVVLLTVASIPPNVALMHQVCPTDSCKDGRLTASELEALASVGGSVEGLVAYSLVINLVPPLIYLLVALLLFVRKPNDGMAFFTSCALLLFGCVTYPDFPAMAALFHPSWVLPVVLMDYAGSVLIIAFFYVFPTGQVVPRALRWVLAYLVVEQAFDATASPPLNWHVAPEVVLNGSFILILATGAYSMVYRYRNVSGTAERRKTKWVVFGVAIALVSILVGGLADFLGVIEQDNVAIALALSLLVTVSVTIIPVSIGIAILRSRLYDIDFLINRTVVYGTVTAVMAGVLAVSSDISKRVFLVATGESSDFAPIVATLVVVAAFDPVRKRVQAGVDRRFKYTPRSFGEFEEKVRSFLELSTPEELLAAFLRESVHRFDARGGAVYRGAGPDAVLVQRLNDDEPVDVSVVLQEGDDLFGLLTLSARPDSEGFGDDDVQNLEEMGALVARAVRRSGADPYRAGLDAPR